MAPVVPTIGAAGRSGRWPRRTEVCDHVSLPGSTSRRGPSRRLPCRGRRVEQGPVRCIRPSHLVEIGVPAGIGLDCVDQPPAIVLVDGHLEASRNRVPNNLFTSFIVLLTDFEGKQLTRLMRGGHEARRYEPPYQNGDNKQHGCEILIHSHFPDLTMERFFHCRQYTAGSVPAAENYLMLGIADVSQ